MAEATQFMFKHEEVVAALIKAQGIHEGIWMLSVTFGFAAANIGSGDSRTDLNPSAVVPVTGIGIRLIGSEHENSNSNLAVDAAKVNPAADKSAKPTRPMQKEDKRSKR